MSRRTQTYNAYESGLTGPLSIGATSVAVDSAAGLVAPLYLVIDPDVPSKREWVRVNTVNANTLENLVRNQEGSVGDVDHEAGAKIRAVWTKQTNDDIFQDIEDTELDLTQHETDGGDPHAQAGYLKEAETDALYVKLVGSTMTGLLTLFADPTISLHAATKQYVDGAVFSADHADLTNVLTDQHHARYTDAEAQAVGDALYLPLTGGTITGNLTVGSNLTVNGDVLTTELRGRVGGTTPIQIKTNDGVVRFAAFDGANTALLDQTGAEQLSVGNAFVMIANELNLNGSGVITNPARIDMFAGSDINMKDDASQSIRLQNNAGSGGYALSKVSANIFQIWDYNRGLACMEIDSAAQTITAVNGFSFV